MANCLLYTIIPELKLIVEYMSGKIDLPTMVNFQIKETEDSLYNADYDNIADLRNAEFVITDGAIKKYAEFVRQTEKMISNRKVAILTVTPNQTAITMMYSQYIDNSPINNKVFSTMEAAIKWIGITSEDSQIVEIAFNNMQMQSKL
jgi:hypothetical protein